MNPETLKPVLSGLLDRPVSAIEAIGGGRNSRVFCVTCDSGERYAAKCYFRHPLDDRDRLGVEFSSLQFLWENGVRSIPRPVVSEKSHNCGVYEYIEGEKISSSSATENDVDAMAQFLIRLKELGSLQGSRNLPPASAACFSVKEIVDAIESRLGRLRPTAAGTELHAFLDGEFSPAFRQISERCCGGGARHPPEVSFDRPLAQSERTLSPSDFGFHNTLRRSDGQIVFLDFEYFGWDDPAKMISDFLLHPGMSLSESLKERFVRSLLPAFEDAGNIEKRLDIVYPVVGLLWCMILLNEFVPEHFARRGFARAGSVDKKNLQAEQLAKAQHMLQHVMRNYERFPYRV